MMASIPNLLVIAGCIIAIVIIGKILLFPIKKILKLLINSILGAVLIFVINLVGATWGFTIGLNIWTALCVGILGIPGVILLVILKLIL